MHHSYGDGVSAVAAHLPMFLDVETSNSDGERKLILSAMSKVHEKEKASQLLLENVLRPLKLNSTQECTEQMVIAIPLADLVQ